MRISGIKADKLIQGGNKKCGFIIIYDVFMWIAFAPCKKTIILESLL